PSFVIAADAGVVGAVVKRMAVARTAGMMNARAPRFSVRNGAPSCQTTALGRGGRRAPAGTHGERASVGADVQRGCRLWVVAGAQGSLGKSRAFGGALSFPGSRTTWGSVSAAESSRCRRTAPATRSPPG